MYGVNKQSKKVKEANHRLEVLYAKIPATQGCLDNINKPQNQGGCNAWCCREQSPQVLYAEFLHSWTHVLDSFEYSKFELLVERCLRRFLFAEKGCVYFDAEKNICQQHQTRPYNCRIYGITPDDEFKPRFERLKVLYPDIKYQCNLIKTENDIEVTKKNIDNWWLELKSIEMSIGVKNNLITDEYYGSYRTYHDHILLELLGEEGVEYLSYVKMSANQEEKERVLSTTLKGLSIFFNRQNEKQSEPKNQNT